jgi:ribosomal protein S12 methylthiotransferase
VRRYWLHTLGCPKNDVDSDKLAHRLADGGYAEAAHPEQADLLVVNTCAFIEAARQESVDTVLALHEVRRPGSRLVVTGCLAERYADELARALPEADAVTGFGQALMPGPGDPECVAVTLGPARRHRGAKALTSSFDLLEAERGPSDLPWAYVKVAEGCDRRCGFCAIPSFRGKQRSRRPEDVMEEVHALVAGDGDHPPLREIVLVAQDLASYGRDRHGPRPYGAQPPRNGVGDGVPIVRLVKRVSEVVERTRLLYLYPSSLTRSVIDTVLDTGVPYFDLSLQHVSRPLLRRMRRYGNGATFLRTIREIRRREPDATLRSSFILGYPGETEADHDQLLGFLEEAQLDWAGFFPFSPEAGTHAVGLPGQVPPELAMERLRECAEVQDVITAARRRRLVGRQLEVLVDKRGQGRSVHEAPDIDGVVHVPDHLRPGELVEVEVTGAAGADLWAAPVPDAAGPPDGRAHAHEMAEVAPR